MKKIIISTSLILLVLALNISCSDLDLAPISTIATGSMWKTKDDAQAAKNGMYYLFREAFADIYPVYTELRNGFYKSGLHFAEQYVAHRNNDLTSSSTGSDWENFFDLNNHCNLILKYVPIIEFPERDKNRILAEAHFIRAFIYFWLVRIWGEVPIITEPFETDDDENLFPNRDPVSDVWALIKNDLAEAEDLFLSGTNIQSSYFANLTTMQMLKTDVYLWLYKVENENDALSKAEDGVNAVLANSSYALDQNFRNVFRNKSNTESIFTIYRSYDIEGSNGFWNTSLYQESNVPEELHNNPIPVGGFNVFIYTDIAWNLLYEEPNDVRSKETIDSLIVERAGGATTYQWQVKYSGEFIDRLEMNQDIQVYRFAEALLFKAEIENEKGNTSKAVDYLNQIAKRAYNVDDYYSSTLSKLEVNDAILKETGKEFFFEGKYWWSLIRFDKIFEKVPTLVGRENEQNVLLWPVHYNTINSNPKITQTPGYD